MTKLDEIPFTDPDALEAWILSHTGEVTPVILGRLITHHGFVEVADLPTTTTVRKVVYAHPKRETIPKLAEFNFTLYNTDPIPKLQLVTALGMLRAFRTWKVSAGVAL